MTAVRAAPIASESTGLQQSYNQDPSLPSNIQWPSFVPAAPRQIDSVLVLYFFNILRFFNSGFHFPVHT